MSISPSKDIPKNPYFYTFIPNDYNMKYLWVFLPFLILTVASCNQTNESPDGNDEIWLGADLSYVNEMLDCGGMYRHHGEPVDPYVLFAEKGCKLVRVRLWHSPDWSGYSDFEDVKETIRRSKAEGMAVLLDFHYSDTWADPQHQVIPAAWADIASLEILGDSLYNYTWHTLLKLHNEGLDAEMVQIGNEVNIEIMQPEDQIITDSINWQRNIYLLNKGLAAVDDFNANHGTRIEKMIHIAQPENAFWWFEQAFANGIGHFEWIGLSYYPKWSSYPLNQIASALDSLITLFEKRIMIVETAYPYTLRNADPAGNILGEDALVQGYPASPQGQLDYLLELRKNIIEGGGEGLIYWEPAWISTSCNTPWGQGSHWENAIFFDAFNQNEALPAFDFFTKN